MAFGGNSSAEAAVALAAALTWGTGDFSGGMAVKAAGNSLDSALRVVMLGHAVSLAALLVIVSLTHGGVPHGWPLAWGLIAGLFGGLSLSAFYMALARGTMGPSAAVSGLLAAAIPALVSSFLEGVPGALRLVGFALAALAIWFIAATDAEDPPGTLALAVVGGLGFGGYFVALRLANPLGIFEPMALARIGSFTTCTVLWILVRGLSMRKQASQPAQERASFTWRAAAWAMGIAVFDTGGNLLYIIATHMGRMDIAAVLASLYPAGTILLAALLLGERLTRKQLAGMALAVVAVVMITW